MRYGYLTSEYPFISHTFIQREIAELRSQGFEIHTFSVRKPNSDVLLTDMDRQECANTWYIRPWPRFRLLSDHFRAVTGRPGAYFRTLARALALRTRGLRGLLKWLAYFAQAIRLAGELQKRRIGHLHNHFANPSVNVALLAATFSNLPWSFTLHGIVEMESDGVGSLRSKVALAKFAVCICDFNRSQAMRMSNFSDWPKIKVSRCGLDLASFPYSSPAPADGRPLRIVSVTRLSMEKGVPGLLEAFRQAMAAGLSAELRVVGDGPERASIEREIDRLGIGAQCTLVGKLAGKALLEEFRRADIFAMASLMEGLPIVLMEAMAVGIPVIAPALAGIPELVVDDKCGLLYAPSRWDQLAGAMVRLGQDAQLYRRLATAGRERIEQLHDIRRTVAPLAEFFEQG